MKKVEFHEFMIVIKDKVQKTNSVTNGNQQIRWTGEDARRRHHEFIIVIEDKVQKVNNSINGKQQILNNR